MTYLFFRNSRNVLLEVHLLLLSQIELLWRRLRRLRCLLLFLLFKPVKESHMCPTYVLFCNFKLLLNLKLDYKDLPFHEVKLFLTTSILNSSYGRRNIILAIQLQLLTKISRLPASQDSNTLKTRSLRLRPRRPPSRRSEPSPRHHARVSRLARDVVI